MEDGEAEGKLLGALDGTREGSELRLEDGLILGALNGWTEDLELGSAEGLGNSVDDPEGILLGLPDGAIDRVDEGMEVGDADGYSKLQTMITTPNDLLLQTAYSKQCLLQTMLTPNNAYYSKWLTVLQTTYYSK
mgnify:CR=1 FL=1